MLEVFLCIEPRDPAIHVLDDSVRSSIQYSLFPMVEGSFRTASEVEFVLVVKAMSSYPFDATVAIRFSSCSISGMVLRVEVNALKDAMRILDTVTRAKKV